MPITDQADVQALLSISSFALNPDPRVTAAIESAQASVEEHCGFLLDQRVGLVSSLTGDGSPEVWLPAGGVQSVASVVEGDSSLVEGTDFWWYPSGRLIRATGLWSTIPQSIVVTYTTGWADKSAAPQRLRWLVARVAARYFSNAVAWAQANGGGIKQETIDGYSVTYQDGLGAQEGLLPGEKKSARRWRRNRIRSVIH